MASAVRRFQSFSRLIGRTLQHRWREGPLDPHWSLIFELSMARLRVQFRASTQDIQRQREAMDEAEHVAYGTYRLRIEDTAIGGVPVRRLTPPKPGPDTLLYLHGGGYVSGSSRSHMPLFAGLLGVCDAEIVSVDYRRAPEHPCPAAIDDVLDVWRALLAEPDFDARRVVLAGDSAGGGLVFTSLLAMREAGLPLPRAAIALSPWTDLANQETSPPERVARDYLGSRAGIYIYARHYVADLDRRDPRVSPLYAPDLSGLPPTLILVGEHEVLREDSERMAECLTKGGVQTTLHVEPGGVHVYPIFASISPAGRNGLRMMADFMRATRS